MHSSRMRTTRFSGHLSMAGISQHAMGKGCTPPQADTSRQNPLAKPPSPPEMATEAIAVRILLEYILVCL